MRRLDLKCRFVEEIDIHTSYWGILLQTPTTKKPQSFLICSLQLIIFQKSVDAPDCLFSYL
jgi:hypothetical protein